jgi:hypothetical protein
MFAALVGLGQRTRAWLLVGSSFHSVKVPWRQEGDRRAMMRPLALEKRHCTAMHSSRWHPGPAQPLLSITEYH